MESLLSFDVHGRGSIRIMPTRLVFAAFASRDPAVAEHHRAELAERGIAVPERIPCFYRGVPSTLSQAARIETKGRRLLPEVEFAVIAAPTGLFVTVGCDLFDEEVEGTDIERSKAVCATPIAAGALPLPGIARWDAFRIWMRCDGRLMQEGRVGELMLPARLVEEGLAGGRPQEPAIVYSGTLPLLGTFGPRISEVEIGLDGASPAECIRHRFRLV